MTDAKKEGDVIAKTASVTAFFVSAFLTLVSAIAFDSGAWLLLAVGAVLIIFTLHYSKKEGRSESAAHLSERLAGGMIGGMGFIGIFAMLYWLGFGESKPSRPEDYSSMAHIQCKEFVRERLKAPSTAEFEFLDFSASIVGDKHYVISSSVEAQNSFGVKLKNNYTCSVKWSGENQNARSNWTLVSLSIDD